MIVNQVGNGPEAPFFSVAANLLGGVPFTPVIATRGKDRAGRFVVVHGRLVAPTSGGSISIRAQMVADGLKPADGAAVGNVLAGKVTFNSTDGDNVSVAGTTETSFSAVFEMNSDDTRSGAAIPIPARHISLRISNPTTAYTGGTLFIDCVEIID